jgi:hypothetical protein
MEAPALDWRLSPTRRAAKRVAIVQSNYIPWKGYFDLIRAVDEFILLDDVQFTRRDWRNRNKIKTKDGLLWLSIPVETKGKYEQLISETRVADPSWRLRHLATILTSYARAACFEEYRGPLGELYAACDQPMLSDVNFTLLRGLCDLLGIDTRITRSSDYELTEGKTDRLVSLCEQAQASEYLCGPASNAYLDREPFASRGIQVAVADYAGYPEYPQLHGPFEHGVSVLDLLLNAGANSTQYMKPL